MNVSFSPLKYQWHQQKTESFCIYSFGWAEYNGEILNKMQLAEVVADNFYESNICFNKFLRSLNGNFSIIVKDKKQVTIGADRMRSFPVTYFFHDSELVLSDDIMALRAVKDFQFDVDESICAQYLRSNYVIGPYTIFKNIYSIQSGEVVRINLEIKTIKREQYFEWAPNMSSVPVNLDYGREAEIQDNIFLSVFSKMVKSAPHIGNWIVPLSGGYDSRIIVNYLCKLGVRNVICFSYGVANNLQSEVARKVAKSLNYPFYFIDYEEWIEKLHETTLIENYLGYGFNGTSVSHLQDFPAVFALSKMGIVNNQDIFVPGHALEVLAGSHLQDGEEKISSASQAYKFIKRHFAGYPYKKRQKDELSFVMKILGAYNQNFNQIPEAFDWKERQTKFIANSVRVYEFFGCHFRLPLWDNELFAYWKEIGFDERKGRALFKRLFKTTMMVCEIKDIPFANDLLEIKSKKRLSKTWVINNLLPMCFRKFLYKHGVRSSSYNIPEGSHMIHTNRTETVSDYLGGFSPPAVVNKYLQTEHQKREIRTFEVNKVSTLLNIKNASSKPNIPEVLIE